VAACGWRTHRASAIHAAAAAAVLARTTHRVELVDELQQQLLHRRQHARHRLDVVSAARVACERVDPAQQQLHVGEVKHACAVWRDKGGGGGTAGARELL
jgi:hypothetical protein